MSVKKFSDAGRLMHWLLDAHERRSTADGVIAHIDYEGIATHAHTQALETTLRKAEKTGAISLEFGRPPHEGHVIKRVRLRDPETLYTHLRRTPAPKVARHAADALRPLVAARPETIQRIPDELEAGWRRQETPYRLTPEDTALAIQFLQLLCGFLDGVHQDVDQRTFCRRATGDSKALEHKGQASRVAQVLARHFELEASEPGDVLEALGIRKYPSPVCLRGPVRLVETFGGVDFTPLRPYAALAPDQCGGVIPTSTPAYVLAIENFASFNRHVREIADAGLIVYTGGFPSRAVRLVIDRLDRELSSSVPFFHWGDIDPWGLRIFRHIEELINRPLWPHLMTREIARQGAEMPGSSTMRRMAQASSAVADLAAFLATHPAHHLEQEQLDPAAPGIRQRVSE